MKLIDAGGAKAAALASEMEAGVETIRVRGSLRTPPNATASA